MTERLHRFNPKFQLYFLNLTSLQEALGTLKRYKLQRLPPYIILHFKRFTKNNFVEEKNPTIINFPLRGVDFRECTPHTILY